jgi:signal transduction histidine kinase
MNAFQVTRGISCTFHPAKQRTMSETGGIRNEQLMASSDTGMNSGWAAFSRYSSAMLLFLVFCAVIVVALFAIRDLRSADVEARKMYAGSVLGLHRIGDLQYDAQETRRSTIYALSTSDSNLHVKYADQSREADHRVTEGIAEYLAHAQTPNELDVGKRLQRDWSAYLNIRDEVLASILEGSTKEAVDLDLSGGAPSFDRVRHDLEEIERLYDETASRQLANVDATSRRTIVRVSAVLGITLVFALASVWAIQRGRMMGAIQLAKLQMEFVASVSHELRTPLAVISSAADNIADGLVKEKDDLKKYGAAIQNQSRQMAELVNQILLFAATKDSKNRLALRPLPVSQILDSVIHQTSELAKRSGFNVELQVEPNLPFVMGDAPALARCLHNMIVNAVKYSGESRWIGIRAFLSHSQLQSRREIQIAVRDRGVGIARSELPHIFEPFYRSPAVMAEQIHGTGLGLSLSKSIAEAMGGRLTAMSELGAGSVFTLHLPVVEDPEFEIPAETPGTKGTVEK